MTKEQTPPPSSDQFDPGTLAGSDYAFEYIEIPARFTKDQVAAFCSTARAHHGHNATTWTKDLNTEWVVRHYLAVKMLLSASVMLTSLVHAQRINLKVVRPYLGYYSLLSCARAVGLTDPVQRWRPGENWTHTKILNLLESSLGRLSSSFAQSTKQKLVAMKDWRETFSYKFPASGLDVGGADGTHALADAEVIGLCRLFAEVAQLSSQALHVALDSASPAAAINDELLSQFCRYPVGSSTLLDHEDAYRLGYIRRKMVRPFQLDWMATEGMVEDFFGSWCSNEDSESDFTYNPDSDWHIIFPFP